MSSVYNLEPQPTASCILHTTSGDISLELWAQQTPLTCRNFLQHCLDGYYDNTIFHRLVPGFIIQGGDPTGTGAGGESIYDGGAFDEAREEHGIWPQEERRGKNAGKHGVGFKDEFHSRLKFNRRGLLGMANEGPDSNCSQFFLTLGDTPELQGKNTVFGRVAGETIYNVSKMGEAELEGDRPIYPTKITSCEILINPFKDMVLRTRTAAPILKEKTQTKKRKKGGKQLLSFGDEEGDGEQNAPVLKKTKFDTRIVTAGDDEEKEHAAPEPLKKKLEKKPEKFTKKVESSPEPQIEVPKGLPTRSIRRNISSSPEPQVEKVTSLLDRTNAQIAELKASMKRNVTTAPVKEKKKSALENLIPETSIKGRKRNHGAISSSKSDQQALDILNAFRSKLESVPAEKESTVASPFAEPIISNGSEAAKAEEDDDEAALCDLHFIANCQSCKSWDAHDEGDDDDDTDIGWMSHALSFTKDKLGKDLSYRKKAEDELVVIDPREKEKTLKEEMKSKREARAGKKTGRQWDENRNGKSAEKPAKR